MNEWQLYQQLKYLALAATWPGSADPVWPSGSVVITPAPQKEALTNLRVPILLIAPGSGRNDKQNPRVLDQDLNMILITSVPGDALGEQAIMGGGRQGASSKGRGLLELQERMYATLSKLTRVNGIIVAHVGQGPADAALDDEDRHISSRGYRSTALRISAGEDRVYPSCLSLDAADHLTPGDCIVQWLLPPSRFDLLGVELWRLPGDTAPATPGDGTQVVLADPMDTSVHDSPGAGAFSYSVFGSYDETGDAVADAYSEGLAASVVVT